MPVQDRIIVTQVMTPVIDSAPVKLSCHYSVAPDIGYTQIENLLGKIGVASF